MDSLVFGDLVVKHDDSFESVKEEEWDALLERSEGCSIFQSFAWTRSWWQTFRAASQRLFLLSVRHKANLVGLAPLFLDRYGTRFHTSWNLRFLGEEHADYLNFLVDSSCPKALDVLLKTLEGHTLPWKRFYCSEVPQASRLCASLREFSQRPASGVLFLQKTPCPAVTIVGNDQNVNKLIQKQSLKRMLTKSSEHGPVRSLHLKTPQEIKPHLAAFFDQHVDRWDVTSSPSLFRKQPNRTFYQSLVTSLGSKGQVLFTLIQFGSRIVAYHFGLLSANNLLWYKPSFDITLFRYSPGEILLRELILLASREHFTKLDFTRGDEPFKMRFADHVTFNESFLWYRESRDLTRHLAKQALRSKALRFARRLNKHQWTSACVDLLKSKPITVRSVPRRGMSLAACLFASIFKWVYWHRRVCFFRLKPSFGVDIPSGVDLVRADLRLLLDARIFPDSEARSPFLQEAFSRVKKKDECFVLIAGETIVSYCWVTHKSPIQVSETGDAFGFDEGCSCLYDCLTLPEFRGKGYYTLTLTSVQKYFPDKTLVIYSNLNNKASLRGISKAGFVTYRILGVRTFLGRSKRYTQEILGTEQQTHTVH